MANEVEAMYLNGPASGGGVTRQVREVIAVASVLMPRALTAERVRAHYAGVVKGRVTGTCCRTWAR